MVSTILITPTTNIKDGRVVDNSKVEKRKYDSDMDVLTFFNEKNEGTRRANLMSVSVFDDVIVEGNTHYKIIQMLSKNEPLLYRIECKKCHRGPARCECWFKHPNEKAIQDMIIDWECFMPRPDELFDKAIFDGICKNPDYRYQYAFSNIESYKKHISPEQEQILLGAGFGIYQLGSDASAIDEKDGQAIVFYPNETARPAHIELPNGIYKR